MKSENIPSKLDPVQYRGTNMHVLFWMFTYSKEKLDVDQMLDSTDQFNMDGSK